MPSDLPQGILHQTFKVSSNLALALLLQLSEPAMVGTQARALRAQVGSSASSML